MKHLLYTGAPTLHYDFEGVISEFTDDTNDGSQQPIPNY